MEIGVLRKAEQNLRLCISLSKELNIEGENAEVYAELGRLSSYCGKFLEAEKVFDIAQKYFEKGEGSPNYLGINWSYRAICFLLMFREDSKVRYCESAIKCATRALDLADETARRAYPVPVDYMRAYWSLGAGYRTRGVLNNSDETLSRAMRICRQINAVYYEADILLELARLRYVQEKPEEAKPLAEEALLITERCGYVLQGADVHLFLAQYALEQEKDQAKAKELAEKAKVLATCDGPPYYYKVAYEEAERMLEEY
jgi:tetratricopeptide (TPR) repeat protein